MQTQQEIDTERRVRTVRDALSDVLPSTAWRTDAQGKELLDIGGVSVYVDGLAHEIVDALDDEFS